MFAWTAKRALIGSLGYDDPDKGVNAVPAEFVQSRAVERGARARAGPRLATSTSDERRRQPWREEVGEHEATARSEHPSALADAGRLVGPVIERGSAGDQIEGAIRGRDALRATSPITIRGSRVERRAASTIEGAGSIPSSSAAPGQRLASTRSR